MRKIQIALRLRLIMYFYVYEYNFFCQNENVYVRFSS